MEKEMRPIFKLALACSIAIPLSLQAAQELPAMVSEIQADYLLHRWDRNADEKISYFEAQSDVDLFEYFLYMDSDLDGFLNIQELQTPHRMGANHMKILMNLASLQQL